MIRYRLKCSQDHSFESWFQSAEAFEGLAGKGLVACAICGDSDVTKAIMAPNLSRKGDAGKDAPALAEPSHPAEQALKDMRENLEKNSTYVGGKFAEEARKIHLGDAPERQIHGEAKPEEARALIEDGVPILPIPFLPKSRAN